MLKLEKIISAGLYLFAFLLPIQTRLIIAPGKLNGGYWEYGTISLYLTDILLVGLFLSAGYFYVKNSPKLAKINQVWFYLAGLDFFVFLSIFFSANKILALCHYGWFLAGLGLVWLILNFNYNFLNLVYFFLAGVFLTAALGVGQFLLQATFASAWLGIAKHQAASLGTSVVQAAAGRWLRAYGSLDHPNILAGLLTVGIIFVFAQLAGNKKSSHLKLTLDYFLLFFLALALFFTFSRAAWLALAAAFLAVLVLVAKPKVKKIKKARIFASMSFLAVFVLALAWLYQGAAIARLHSRGRLELKSWHERAELTKQSLFLIKKHFWTGVGLGNYTLAVYGQINARQPSWYYQPAHNVFLLVWAETGLFGFLFFSALFFYLFSRAYKKWLDQPEGLFIFLPLLTALIIMLNFDHWWWSLHFGVLFFWFILGLAIKSLSYFEKV